MMHPEDDYLRLKPADRDHRTATRIALAALLGCLMLISALVVQATFPPDASTGIYVTQNRESGKPVQTRSLASSVLTPRRSVH